MSTPTPTDYPTLLMHARIAALQALTDILATTEDPAERRSAATAILRTPDPSNPKPARSPTPRQPTGDHHARAETPKADSTPRGSSLRVEPSGPHAASFTIDLNDDLEDLDDLLNVDLPQLLPVFRSARRRRSRAGTAVASACPSG